MEVIKSRYKINKGLKKRSRFWPLALIVFTFIFIVSGSGYGYMALSKSPPLLSASIKTPAVKQPEIVLIPWLGEGQAAIGSLEDGVLAVSTEYEQPKPIASMTKIITALAVLLKSPEPTNYTISTADVASYQSYKAKGGSVVQVKNGQVLTRTEAFEALLLASANNIADSLVGWHFASMQEFTDFANKMVKDFGLEHTVIADASGFSPQTVSTPSDLLVIAQKAMAKPEIAQIVVLREANIPGSGLVRNTNKLLVEPGVIGIKTGTTDEAGNCLLFAAEHSLPSGKKIILLGVVMGAPNSSVVFSNSKSLLTTAAANYQEIEVVPSGSEVGTFTSDWGQSTKLVTAAVLKTESWKGESFEPKLVIEKSGNFVSKNEVVGKLQLDESTEVDIIAQDPIGLPSNLWRLANYW